MNDASKHDLSLVGLCESDFDDLFHRIEHFDSHLSNLHGLCRFISGEIVIDAEIQSQLVHKAVIEHEMTHRADLFFSHYGNLLNLVLMAYDKRSDFPSPAVVMICELVNCFTPRLFETAMEGRASFNQRLVLKVSDEHWSEALRKRKNPAYYNGYRATSRIMRHFSVREPLLQFWLSDELLSLPFCTPWYEHCESIAKARDFIVALADDQHPNGRLRLLGEALDEVALEHPRLFEQVSAEIERAYDDLATSGSPNDRQYDIPISSVIGAKVTHTTNQLQGSLLVRSAISRLLRGPLSERGFRFAERESVPTINRIVDSWNREAKHPAMPIPAFRDLSPFEINTFDISIRPLNRKRAVDFCGVDRWREIVHAFIGRCPHGYCIARLHQVLDRGGWAMSATKILPRGYWYALLVMRVSDLYGGRRMFTSSPEWKGEVTFVQKYHLSRSARASVLELPASLLRTLWLLPSTESAEYLTHGDMAAEAEYLRSHIRNTLGSESRCFSVLGYNTVNCVARHIALSRPRSYTCQPYGDRMRLWLTQGEQDTLFITANIGDSDIFLERLLQDAVIGAKYVAEAPSHLPLLAEWLCCGEGF